ncbi:MAG: hypothetical protein IJC50_02740 [Clostridia bacterium]|nr:hypothetical protein [Clostridia bacterium]
MSDNNKLKKFFGIAFIVFILVIMVAGLIVTVFFPHEINQYENRYANKIKLPTLSSINDQSFQDSIEDALSDQIPLAEKAKVVYNIATSSYLNRVLSPIIKLAPPKYVPYSSLWLFGEDNIVYPSQKFHYVEDLLNNRAVLLNSIFEKNPELDFYVYYVEKDTDINFETGEKIATREHIVSQLNIPEENKGRFEIDSFDTFKEYFYKTDHHWNYKGSYKGYTECLELLKINDAPLEPIEKITLGKFTGSKGAAVGAGIDQFSDDLTVYTFDLPERSVIANGYALESYTADPDKFEDKSEVISYAAYYGGDIGELIFSTGDESKENIVIIGESYDNAILELLAGHFNNLYSIDLRHYERTVGKKFVLSEYAEDKDIDKVLLIGNSDFFTDDDFIME